MFENCFLKFFLRNRDSNSIIEIISKNELQLTQQ